MSEEEVYHDEILPFDILIEVLKKLPIKSLIRFISVSKSWKSIIKSSEFVSDYNNCHIQPHHLLFVGFTYKNYVDIFDDDDDNRFLQRLTLPEHPFFKRYKLIGYSQGLFGFLCFNNILLEDFVVIWNPSIRKSVVIPVSVHSFFLTGFGFTVCNATDPTIFKTTYICGSLRILVEIYRLSTGVWRTLDIVPPRESLQLLLLKEVMIGSFIHWIAHDRTPEGVFLHNLILSFDTISEQFTELRLPPDLASLGFLKLSKLKESLVVLEQDVYKQEIGVWMMMEAGIQNSFTKLYTLKPPYRRSTILGFRNSAQPIFNSDFYKSYLERFNDINVIWGDTYPSTAGSYMETLLLLDH